MSKYFEKIPNIIYTLNDNPSSELTVVKNIFARTRIVSSVINNAVAFFKYITQDYDTPEMIAHKYYGNAEKHWIVMFSNYITDPYFEFPMNSTAFQNYIINKYGSEVAAQSTLHHVEQVTFISNSSYNNEINRIETTEVSEYYYDAASQTMVQRTMPTIGNPVIDLGTVTTTLADSTTCSYKTQLLAVSAYTYEYAQNEARRTIKLLDPSYVPAIEAEFSRLMS
jgi:hypothetical protein